MVCLLESVDLEPKNEKRREQAKWEEGKNMNYVPSPASTPCESIL